MSLLDVFVIFAYYCKAEKAGAKITAQQFDNEYVKAKIKEIQAYHSSALHWNLNELKTNLCAVIDNVKKYYKVIEQKTGVALHNFKGLDNFQLEIEKSFHSFINFSRNKAQSAQTREVETIQPKESLARTDTKAKITISNYLGGLYFFTVDEIIIEKDKVFLIESKHSNNNVLPSKSDIKDGLLKMILYSNLIKITVNGAPKNVEVILKLTSPKLINGISSKDSVDKQKDFISCNKLSPKQIGFIDKLFAEANKNKFIVNIRSIK
jgi:hypothetical protein